jgi:uncharacterized membrane protein
MPDAGSPLVAAEPDLLVVSRRNDSLGGRQRWLVFGALAGVSLSLATAFALAGAWPVLMYSALELALLAMAFRLVARGAGEWERLTVAGDRVVVERHWRGGDERHEYNRYWVRVEYHEHRGADRFGGGRLTLRSAGEAVTFGDAMALSERRAVAMKLRRLTVAR